MNVREEERRKPASSSRGLGLATAAIGLGVGAALYYFLSKGSPHQESEGTSGSNWTQERANVFKLAENAMDSDSYSTISEGTTSDTSVHDNTTDNACASSAESTNDTSNSSFQNTLSDTSTSDCNSNKFSIESDYSFTSTIASESTESASDNQSDSDFRDSESDEAESDKESDYEDSENDETAGDYTESEISETQTDYAETDISIESSEEDTELENLDLFFDNGSNTASLETGYTSSSLHIGNSDDSDTAMEWDVTSTSVGIPAEERSSSLLHIIEGFTNMISPRKAPQEDRLAKLRERAFRERPWTLEECSICFDVMLRDQEIMTLSCTHNFHAQCIMPWLQEKQTCPNCRKHAD